MKKIFNSIMFSRKISELEKEVAYYKKIAKEAGQKRLTEINQMNQLIEEKKAAEEEREMVIQELKRALEEVKTLQGFIPICASCKKIRDDKGYWNQIEHYIQNHSDVTFSHGICPECLEKAYGKENWYKTFKKEIS
jgi:hypothetical protein